MNMSEIANIHDENFRKCIMEQLNKPSGYKITKEDCESIKSISCEISKITSLDGIEYFVNLQSLYCYNNQLTSLDLSKNIDLTYLYCQGNQLTSLYLNKNTKLIELHCNYNQLTSLDLSKNVELSIIHCNNNHIESLNLSKNIKLIHLGCYNNKLTSLDLSKNKNLYEIKFIDEYNISNIELNNNIELISNYTSIITNYKNLTIQI